MKFKVITEKQINKLESALNDGWELAHVATYDNGITYILRKKK